LQQITIHIGHKADGFVFRLDSRSDTWVRKLTGRLQSLPTVSIGFDEATPLSDIKDEVFIRVAEMLTGISSDQLATMGVRFVDARTEKTVHTI
jgi:hypothetical protein